MCGALRGVLSECNCQRDRTMLFIDLDLIPANPDSKHEQCQNEEKFMIRPQIQAKLQPRNVEFLEKHGAYLETLLFEEAKPISAMQYLFVNGDPESPHGKLRQLLLENAAVRSKCCGIKVVSARQLWVGKDKPRKRVAITSKDLFYWPWR